MKTENTQLSAAHYLPWLALTLLLLLLSTIVGFLAGVSPVIPVTLVETAAVVASIVGLARVLLWFHFRKLSRYLYGQKNEWMDRPSSLPDREQKLFVNYAFADFKKLEPRWIKLCFAFFWIIWFTVLSVVIFCFLLKSQGGCL
jgi:hypothetical protein